MRSSVVAMLLAAALAPVTAGGPSEVDPASQCIPCHGGSPSAVPDLVAEWRASPYSDPVAGLGCVDCHPVARTTFAAGSGGHLAVPRSTRPREAVSVGLVVERSKGGLFVQASLCNSGAGHALPAAAWPAVMVLVVEARDGSGRTLELLAGSRPPPWTGMDAAEAGGRAWSGTPVGTPVPAERLAPYHTEVNRFVFRSAPDPVSVEARVLRGWADGRDWVILAAASSSVAPSPFPAQR